MTRADLIRADFTTDLRTPARKNIEPRWPQFEWGGTSAVCLAPYHLKLIEDKVASKPFPTRELLSNQDNQDDHGGKRVVKLISRAILVNKLLSDTDVEIDVRGAISPDPTVVFRVRVGVDEVHRACYDYIVGDDDPITNLYNTEAETRPYDWKSKDDKGGLVIGDDLISELVKFDVEACIEKRKAGFAKMMADNPKAAAALAKITEGD